MQIEKFGCEILYPGPRVFAPAPDGKALLFWNENAKTAQGIANFSPKDSAKYLEFADALDHLTGVPRQLFPSRRRPSTSHSRRSRNLLKTGRNVRMLRRKEFLPSPLGPHGRCGFRCGIFDTELIRAFIAARGISALPSALGLQFYRGPSHAPPLRYPSCLHCGFSSRRLGNFTQALAESAKQAGAEIRTDAEVRPNSR